MPELFSRLVQYSLPCVSLVIRNCFTIALWTVVILSCKIYSRTLVSIFVEQKCDINFCLKKKSSAFHAVKCDYKISAGLDTVIFRRRGWGCGVQAQLYIDPDRSSHPIPTSACAIIIRNLFSIRPSNMQIQHCTSKWFYLLKKTMHVLRKYNMFILSLHYAEFAQQNGSDFCDNAGGIWSTAPQQNKSKYFFHVQLPLK